MAFLFPLRTHRGYLLFFGLIIILQFFLVSFLNTGFGGLGFAFITHSSLVFLWGGIAEKEFRWDFLKFWSFVYLAFCLALSVGIIGELVTQGFPSRWPMLHYSPDKLGKFFGSQSGHHVAAVVLYLGTILSASYYVSLFSKKYLALGGTFFVLSVMLSFHTATVCLALTFVTLSIIGAAKRIKYSTLVRLPKSVVYVLLIAVCSGLIAFGTLNWLKGMSYFTNSIEKGARSFSGKVYVPEGELSSDDLIAGKIQSHVRTLMYLPLERPSQPLVGIGLGGYSSRAALIQSGHYLDNQPSWIPPVYNEVSWDLVLRWWRPVGANSTRNQPWSSWQSLYAETGLLGVLFLITLVGKRIKNLGSIMNFDKPDQRGLYYGMVSMTVFLGWVFLFTNFLEFPWVSAPIFVGYLLIPWSTAPKRI